MGNVYEGKVLRLLEFGAIVSVLPGKDGLLHISQLANERLIKYLIMSKRVRMLELKL